MLTAEQVQERANYIGASDTSTILGLNKYKTPLELWLEKTGQKELDDLSDNESVHFGNVLEDIVAQEYARRNNAKVQRRNSRVISQDFPFMSALLDRVVVGEKRPLEIKTTHEMLGSQWGDVGTDDIPDHPLVQVMHQMIVLKTSIWPELESADVAVLIGGNKYRDYTVAYDADLAGVIIEQNRAFWNCVETMTPPEIKTVGDVELLYPIDNGKFIAATEQDAEALARLARLTKDAKAFTDEIDEIKAAMKKRILGASGIDDPQGILGADGVPLCTYKAPKASARFDAKKFIKENPQLAADYMATVQGSRRFLNKVKV